MGDAASSETPSTQQGKSSEDSENAEKNSESDDESSTSKSKNSEEEDKESEQWGVPLAFLVLGVFFAGVMTFIYIAGRRGRFPSSSASSKNAPTEAATEELTDITILKEVVIEGKEEIEKNKINHANVPESVKFTVAV